MERDKAEGKLIGRPLPQPVEDDPRWPKVRDLVLSGVLTRQEGARRLPVRDIAFSEALGKSAG
jgi:hypothetical protein